MQRPPEKSYPIFPNNPSLKVEVLSSPPSPSPPHPFKNLVGDSTSPAERGRGGVYTMRKPLKLIANMNKKSVGCDNESWRHNFSNPKHLLRFNRLKDLIYNDVMELSLLPQLTDFLEYGK